MPIPLRISSRAERQLRQIDRAQAERILARLEWAAANFDDIPRRPLHGDFAGQFKLRIGSYRAIFEVRDGAILVHSIGHRRDVYE